MDQCCQFLTDACENRHIPCIDRLVRSVEKLPENKQSKTIGNAWHHLLDAEEYETALTFYSLVSKTFPSHCIWKDSYAWPLIYRKAELKQWINEFVEKPQTTSFTLYDVYLTISFGSYQDLQMMFQYVNVDPQDPHLVLLAMMANRPATIQYLVKKGFPVSDIAQQATVWYIGEQWAKPFLPDRYSLVGAYLFFFKYQLPEHEIPTQTLQLLQHVEREFPIWDGVFDKRRIFRKFEAVMSRMSSKLPENWAYIFVRVKSKNIRYKGARLVDLLLDHIQYDQGEVFLCITEQPREFYKSKWFTKWIEMYSPNPNIYKTYLGDWATPKIRQQIAYQYCQTHQFNNECLTSWIIDCLTEDNFDNILSRISISQIEDVLLKLVESFHPFAGSLMPNKSYMRFLSKFESYYLNNQPSYWIIEGGPFFTLLIDLIRFVSKQVYVDLIWKFTRMKIQPDKTMTQWVDLLNDELLVVEKLTWSRHPYLLYWSSLENASIEFRNVVRRVQKEIEKRHDQVRKSLKLPNDVIRYVLLPYV